jgi:hypothetical protein
MLYIGFLKVVTLIYVTCIRYRSCTCASSASLMQGQIISLNPDEPADYYIISKSGNREMALTVEKPNPDISGAVPLSLTVSKFGRSEDQKWRLLPQISRDSSKVFKLHNPWNVCFIGDSGAEKQAGNFISMSLSHNIMDGFNWVVNSDNEGGFYFEDASKRGMKLSASRQERLIYAATENYPSLAQGWILVKV